MSTFVTHFVKYQANAEDAAEALMVIVRSGELIGGNGFILGSFNCVCFSDEPVGGSFNGLLARYGEPLYAPFGISVHKTTLFGVGGRPVIYQRRDEYDLLPEEIKWRHVTYNPPIPDFTWEREWRVRVDTLPLRHLRAFLVVPNTHAVWFKEQLALLEASNPTAYIPGLWSFEDARPLRRP